MARCWPSSRSSSKQAGLDERDARAASSTGCRRSTTCCTAGGSALSGLRQGGARLLRPYTAATGRRGRREGICAAWAACFEGDALEAAPRTIPEARKALEERGLPTTDENVFLVLAAMVPGKKVETNEGIRLLTGEHRIDIPLKPTAKPPADAKAAAAPAATSPAAAPTAEGQFANTRFTTECTVQEGGKTRTFTVTLEPIDAVAPTRVGSSAKRRPTPRRAGGTNVFLDVCRYGRGRRCAGEGGRHSVGRCRRWHRSKR
jgi:hypothetical protein